MNSSNITEDYFSGLFENRSSKISAVIVSFCLNILNVVLAYGIIWYDRYGIDKKQNLMNKLITSICWVLIITVPILQLFEIPRYFFGPQPALFCFIQMVIKKASKWQLLLLLDASILTRYIFIFWLKNPNAVHDGFWSIFVNIWIFGFSLITNAVLLSRYTFNLLGFIFVS